MRERRTVPDNRLRPDYVAALGEKMTELQAAVASERMPSEELRRAVSDYV